MKISMTEVGHILQAQAVVRARDKSPNATEQSASVQSNGPAASVEISSAAKDLQRIKTMVSSQPDTREDLIQSIKTRIDNGTYKVSGSEIADLMVRRAYADRIS